jgi:hypothetical protein
MLYIIIIRAARRNRLEKINAIYYNMWISADQLFDRVTVHF